VAVAQAYAKHIGLAAVMIVDDGVVVAAWGDMTHEYLLAAWTVAYRRLLLTTCTCLTGGWDADRFLDSANRATT
jgi:hypothetical protein